MEQVVTIGLDIAKSVFQVHGIDAQGAVVVRQRLQRSRVLPFFAKRGPCLVGIEACGSAHHWACELARLVHEVRLIPPSHVKPYVKRQKNDMADAEAICEAVTRPTMRFVPVKSPEQQSVMVLHRTRLIPTRCAWSEWSRRASCSRSSAPSRPPRQRPQTLRRWRKQLSLRN